MRSDRGYYIKGDLLHTLFKCPTLYGIITEVGEEITNQEEVLPVNALLTNTRYKKTIEQIGETNKRKV